MRMNDALEVPSHVDARTLSCIRKLIRSSARADELGTARPGPDRIARPTGWRRDAERFAVLTIVSPV